MFISDILAEPCISSVVIPAWDPDRLITFLSRDFMDIAKRVDDTNSPVDNKVSFSLKSGAFSLKVTSSDILTSSSVDFPIAETTTIGKKPASFLSETFLAIALSFSTSPIEVPPYF